MLQQRDDQRKSLIRPKYYSNENSLIATGLTPRALRSAAERMGVRVYWPGGGRRWCVDADEFDAALKQEAKNRSVNAAAPMDDAEALMREIGLEVRK